MEAENTGEVHACRRLLRDIEDVRASKIRKGTRMVMDEVKNKDHVHDVSSLINFRNLTFAELNNARPTLKMALDTLADINPRAVSKATTLAHACCLLNSVLNSVLLSWLQASGEGGDVLGGGAGGEVRKEDRAAASDDAPRRKLRKYR